MQFKFLPILGVFEIFIERHLDERGYFAESFRLSTFCEHAGDVVFVQENESLSLKVGTVRGLHFQSGPFAQGKLVRCTAGAVFDVAVDLRNGSPSYGKWVAVELSPEAGNQLWIPVGFAHGFCALKENSVLNYKVSAYYSAEHDRGVAWDDPNIAIDWPIFADPETLSAKDRAQPALVDLSAYFQMDDQACV